MSRASPVIVFRTEGDPEVGLGHVTRCLALASRLAALMPGRCAFAMRTQNTRVVEKIAAGYEVIGLPPRGTPEEAAQAIAQRTPEAVVSDLPEAAELEALRATAPVLVAMDDLGTADCGADIVVNGTVVPQFRAYEPRDGTQFLLGPAHMVLREEFARCGAQVRAFPRTVRTAVVSMGGADQQALAPGVVRTLAAVGTVERCTIIAGPLSRGVEALCLAADASRMACRVVADPPAMAPLLRGADLAVTCGGMTLYEAAAVGTPTIALPQAAPQVTEIAHFAQRGAAASVGGPEQSGNLAELAELVRDLSEDIERRKEMSRSARALVDGRGVHRVAAAILQVLAAPAGSER